MNMLIHKDLPERLQCSRVDEYETAKEHVVDALDMSNFIVVLMLVRDELLESSMSAMEDVKVPGEVKNLQSYADENQNRAEQLDGIIRNMVAAAE